MFEIFDDNYGTNDSPLLDMFRPEWTYKQKRNDDYSTEYSVARSR